MARTLHLIKHGRPALVPGVPAHEWTLAADALTGLDTLLAHLTPLPEIVVSSEESKAAATAQALRGALGAAGGTMLGLHEHLRYTTDFTTVPEFQARVQRFFREPDALVMGEESAVDARTRFRNAVHAVMRRYPQDTVAVVAHGTVISLLAAQVRGADPLALWQNLDFLGVITLPWPAGS